MIRFANLVGAKGNNQLQKPIISKSIACDIQTLDAFIETQSPEKRNNVSFVSTVGKRQRRKWLKMRMKSKNKTANTMKRSQMSLKGKHAHVRRLFTGTIKNECFDRGLICNSVQQLRHILINKVCKSKRKERERRPLSDKLSRTTAVNLLMREEIKAAAAELSSQEPKLNETPSNSELAIKPSSTI